MSGAGFRVQGLGLWALRRTPPFDPTETPAPATHRRPHARPVLASS